MEHCQGGARCYGGRLRHRCRRPQRHRGPRQGWCLPHYRRGHLACKAGTCQEMGCYGRPQLEGASPGQDRAGGDRLHDRVRRGLLLRLHGQRAGHALRARGHAHRLGPERHHRRRRGRPGDLHSAVPARHGPPVEGHGLRRLQEPLSGAWPRRRLHERRGADRPLRHAQPEPQGHQRCLCPDARGQVPARRDLDARGRAVRLRSLAGRP
mmetsp:Transcript_119432/g.363370  ORF Transcript_119432/g.363370 Transcript_119432/m.363370 type:complete len:209 (+) Transcript_119432:1500-2126(+)